ncbi:N-acetylmuramoyl-L-alanine amidase [uncultured Roseibium sp.]|uniref:N-acetylmuramoyl-L-alanine amidase n=1 Tax=uncultured Roseibium sp. TaxID=1936171 RepID=UPI00262716D9|nr:N-acetylmuramoyl-L-alanine amidase [uncultured Roseibium sp.]
MFKIDKKHRLMQNGKLVRRIMSPAAHTNGKFASTPSTTVMHFTFGATASSSAEWFRDPNNKFKSSAHIVIGRDGEVIQCVDFDTGANHAGKSTWKGRPGLNTWAFGIELANWGYLQKKGGTWWSWTGKTEVASPVLAKHKNGNPNGTAGLIGWEPYPDVQIETAAAIVRVLIDTYGRQELVGHDDISVGRKWDPGPAFDFDSFRMMTTEDLSDNTDNFVFSNTPGDTLNLRQGPGMHFDVITALKDGTQLMILERDGNWLMVNVYNATGKVVRTGWVYAKFVV